MTRGSSNVNRKESKYSSSYRTLAKCTAALSVFVALSFPVANADGTAQPQAEILHWWSSDGEFEALSVFIEEFKARGGRYYNTSKADQPSNRQEALERMAKGYPATLTQWNAGNDLIQMFDFGLIKPIDDVGIVQRLKDTLPPAVLDAVSYQGQIIAVPLNIHSENWFWYSNKHFSQADIDLSGDWSELLSWGAALAEENIPLLAAGDQPWQIRILFSGLFLGFSREHYDSLYIAGDPDVVDSEIFQTMLETFSQLARYSRSFGDGAWDTQIKAVVENEAAANFMGDWARSAFREHGQRAGVDYGCKLTSSGEPSLLMGIDTLVLGKVSEQTEIDGQRLMLDVVLDPDFNLKFNTLKGSASPYSSLGSHESDPCTAQVSVALNSDGALVPPYLSTFPNASYHLHHIDQAVYALWVASQDSDSNLEVLVADTRAKLRTALQKRAHDLSKKQKKQ